MRRDASKTHGFWKDLKDNHFAAILLGLVCFAAVVTVAYIIAHQTTGNNTGFDTFVKDVLNANGLQVPARCRSKGRKQVGGWDNTDGETLYTAYTACHVQCSAGYFLMKLPLKYSPGHSPFNDELLVGFDENGVLGAYTA
eukprot:721701_1